MNPKLKKVFTASALFIILLIVSFLLTAPWMTRKFCYNFLVNSRDIDITDNVNTIEFFPFGRQVHIQTHLIGFLNQSIQPKISEDLTTTNVWGAMIGKEFYYFVEEITANETITEYQFITNIESFTSLSIGDEVYIKGIIFSANIFNTTDKVQIINLANIGTENYTQRSYYLTVFGTVHGGKN
jgi:hypothetical protein